VVYLDGSTDDDPTAASKPAERIRPNVVFHRPHKARTVQELRSLAADPEELEDDTPAKMAVHIATRGQQVLCTLRPVGSRCAAKIDTV